MVEVPELFFVEQKTCATAGPGKNRIFRLTFAAAFPLICFCKVYTSAMLPEIKLCLQNTPARSCPKKLFVRLKVKELRSKKTRIKV